MTDRPLRLLFLLRNLYYLRNFEAPIRALAGRGHDIVVLADPAKHLPPEVHALIQALQRDLGPAISLRPAHGRQDFRQRVADDIHTARDILRYYTPPFRSANRLRRRAASKATPLARRLYDRSRYWDPARNAAADRRLALWDETLPVDRSIAAEIDAINPDLLVVAPLVDLRTDQIDWVRAARAAAIPTVLAVASWDNLTSKSRIQAEIDRALVWNDIQKREAIDLHGVPEASVVVTGAQLHDDWFDRKPSTGRDAFCAMHGFDPSRPILLYVGSSTAISTDEPAFVARWIAAIRGADDPHLAGANVLVRPHPMNFAGYGVLRQTAWEPVSVAPERGGLPVTEEAKALYFDTLFHSDVVVGLNTSALVEASILGKGSHTIRDPRHAGGQEQTLHYHYLTAGRILHEAASLDDHVTMLTATLRQGESDGAADAFVTEFIRPHGRDIAATPRFVEAVEAAAAIAVAPAPSANRLRRLLLDAFGLADHLAIAALRRLRGRNRNPSAQAPQPAPAKRRAQDAK